MKNWIGPGSAALSFVLWGMLPQHRLSRGRVQWKES